MKLSDAMILGSTLVELHPGDWTSCALGCAATAVGIPDDPNNIYRPPLILEYWPWLAKLIAGTSEFPHTAFVEIFLRFDYYVCDGKMTFEELVAYVRSIEPPCECGYFNCCCDRIRGLVLASEAELAGAHQHVA